MDHEVDVIHQNPLSNASPFHMLWLAAVVHGQLFFDGICNGDDLTVRTPVTDYEVVGDVAEPFQVQDANIATLLVLGSCYAGL